MTGGCDLSGFFDEPVADLHPTRFLSFESQGQPIEGDTAIINLFVGDTVFINITAYDQDSLVYWESIENGRLIASITPAHGDTMVVQSGIIGDAAYFPVGIVFRREIVVYDALGYSATKTIQFLIQQKPDSAP